MKKEIRLVDTARGIVQVTTVDERWYAIPEFDKDSGLPARYLYLPSVTWIASHYPKGIGFYKWLAGQGWDESIAVRDAAGRRGTKVHHGVSRLIAGDTIPIDGLITDDTGQETAIALDEFQALMSFRDWARKEKPEFLANEITVINTEDGYAGTIDLLCRIDGSVWIVDVKTGQDIWPEHGLQLSAYSHTPANLESVKITEEEWAGRKLAVLQLGYRRNKAGWKFTEVEDCYDLFLAAKQIWQHENSKEKPLQRDYPLELALDKVVESKEE